MHHRLSVGGFDNVRYDRSRRNSQQQIFSIFAGTVGSSADAALLGFKLLLRCKITQGIGIVVGYDIHIAAITAVTSVRSAHWHVFFAAPAHTATSAVTARNDDGGFI